MKKIITAIFFILLIPAVSLAQGDSKYKKSLTTLFEVSGTQEAYKAAIKQMMVMYKTSKSEVPAEIWDDLEKEFLSTSLSDLVDMLAPVYEKYMTKDDLDKIIEFYKTPVGKKYAESTPLITQESMAVGQEWGAKVGQEFMEKLKKKGY